MSGGPFAVRVVYLLCGCSIYCVGGGKVHLLCEKNIYCVGGLFIV